MASTNPRRMTKRSRGGSAGSRQFHAVPEGSHRYRTALCGARPTATGSFNAGTRSVTGARGWSENVGKQVTCSKCLALMAASTAQKAA